MVENRDSLSLDERSNNWYNALSSAIENIAARKTLAADKKKWAIKRWSMEANVPVYIAAFERIGNLKQAKGTGTLPGVFWFRKPKEEKKKEEIALKEAKLG